VLFEHPIQSASTVVFSDLNSYQKMLNFGASSGPSETDNVSGTLTAGYSNMKSSLVGSSIRIGYKEYDRYIYKTTPQNTNPFTVTLHPFFLSDLSYLPTTYSYSVYQNFLDNYGMYYFDYVIFGVSATVTSLVDECVFQANSAESVSLGLEASAETTGVDGSASFSQSEVDARSCLSGHNRATMLLLGGDFTKFACAYDNTQVDFVCNGTWDAYASTAIYNPWRIQYKLTRISRLVANATISANLDQGITDWLISVNSTLSNVLPKPYTAQPCPCPGPNSPAADAADSPISLSSNLIIGIVAAGAVFAGMAAVALKKFCAGGGRAGGVPRSAS